MKRPNIEGLEKLLSKVELPWPFSGNIPFDIQVKRPRNSLSKHSSKNPCSWHYDDGQYLATAVHEVPKLIAYIKFLETKEAYDG